MKNNFNRIAPVYDALAQLVFGDKLKKVQQVYLDHLLMNDKVLIVGGGTGEILEWLPKEARVMVDYLELSSAMINKARKRKSQALETNFINGDIVDHEGKYDVIIASFFLDCFDQDDLEKVLHKLASLLKVEGKLLVTDFALTESQRDKLLQKVMHQFFKITANLRSDHLKNIRGIMLASDFIEIRYQTFEKERLFAGVYGKRLTQ